jgi:hypothetical protein
MVGPFQEQDGAVSMRRILAAFFSIAAVALGGIAIPDAPGWYVFIPSGLCIFATLILLLFTTWGDVSLVVASYKGKE